MMDKDSLNGDTGLTGIPESSGRATLRGKFKVGIRFHDYARIPAKFQYHLLLPTLGLQHPSHSSAAGKAQEFEARIGDKLFCYRIVAGQNVQCTRRKSSLESHLTQEQCGQRRLWRR